MRSRIWLGLMVVLLVAADAPKDEGKKDQGNLQGTWQIVSEENNEKEGTEEAIKGAQLIVKDATWKLQKAEKIVFTAEVALGADRKPKTFDLVIGEKEKKTTIQGIYEVDGDTLKTCIRLGEGERPKEFSTKGGKKESALVLSVYKRQKP